MSAVDNSNADTPASLPALYDNALYLRRRSRIILPDLSPSIAPAAAGTTRPPVLPQYLATLLKNMEVLGYGFSPELIDAARTLTPSQLLVLYQDLLPILSALKGAHRAFEPMYPNFPEQVMEMSEGELYLNAIVHYWTAGKLFPITERRERFPLLDNVELAPIGLGSVREFQQLFQQMVGANAAFSEQDKTDVAWFVEAYGDAIRPLIPEAIPQKENAAYLAGLLLKRLPKTNATELVARFTRTATDILRLAVAQSGGDVSLATACKFRTFSRPERHLLLALLERLTFANMAEDMLRWKGRWIRLGEKLHPGEYRGMYPNTIRAFGILRNDEPFTTFNSGVEAALAKKDVAGALSRLATRPGDLSRRLDHLLRTDADAASSVISVFADVANKVSTPVLLQVRQHFLTRTGKPLELRVFFPKGNLAKSQAIENTLPPLPTGSADSIVAICETALKERFALLEPLGKVYVDPLLRDYMMPFALRSASRTLRTLVRGSRLPLPAGCMTLRFFIWWKNGDDRTDIDLSAAIFSEDFVYRDILSYYNLKGFGGVHSGDIVDAPEGASEFIDVTLEKLRKQNVRYVVMSLYAYTRQTFVELPECFAGWMARQKPESGEIYDPRTVQDRLDLTADTRVAIPLVIDVQENQVIWCDMALRRDPRWVNNTEGNIGGVTATLRSFVEMRRANLYDLFRLHAETRGTLSDSAEDAETVFSVANGTPFRLEEIAADYMA